MMLWKMVVETVVLDCQDEKVQILNVLPVQKLVSFSPRTEPCSTKCEEVLTVDENVEPEHDIHAKLEIKDVDKTGDDRGNCMFSSGRLRNKVIIILLKLMIVKKK